MSVFPACSTTAPFARCDLTRDGNKVVKRHIAVAALATVICVSAAPGQVDVSTISARIGTIRTLWRDNTTYEAYLWTVYPELEIGGRLFMRYLSWGASWGYWSDGIDKVLPVVDMATYSQASHILGLRIGFHPQLADEHWPIPLVVFGGLSHHMIKTRYIGGGDFPIKTTYAGEFKPYTINDDHSTTIHLGLGVTIPMVGIFSLDAEAQQFIPFGSSESEQTQKNRRAFKIGLQARF
jgi:hypothetical protein